MSEFLMDAISRSISRRVVVRTGARLAYAAPLVVATYPLTPLRADAKAKQDLISVDAAEALAMAATDNLPPVASAGPNVRVTDTDNDGVEAVTLDGSGSTDPDGTVVAYEWTLGGQPLSSDPVATIELPVGKHSVYLRVTDDEGATHRDRVWVRVDPAPPPEPEPPAAPSRVEAAQRRERVSVTWRDESDDATGFRVYRSDDGGATWGVVGEVSADRRSLRDSGVAAGGSYAYVVAAFNDAGESPWPDAAWVTLEAPPEPAEQEQSTEGAQIDDQGSGDQPQAAPQIPATPTKLVAKEKEKLVELRWRHDADDANGFRIYRSGDGGTTWNPIAELAPNKTSYRDADVAPGATYAYAVAAFNDAVESAWPEPAWVTLEVPPAPAEQEQAVQTAEDDGDQEDGDQSEDQGAPGEEAPAASDDAGDQGQEQDASAEDAQTDDQEEDG